MYALTNKSLRPQKLSQNVWPLGAGYVLPTSASCPAAKLTRRTSTWRSAEGDGSVGDKASDEEHVSNSAAVKIRPDVSREFFNRTKP